MDGGSKLLHPAVKLKPLPIHNIDAVFRNKFLQHLQRYLGFEQPARPVLPIFPGDPPVKLQG
ncbi:hypothetical protein D3C75_1355900 [compost metagenome]